MLTHICNIILIKFENSNFTFVWNSQLHFGNNNEICPFATSLHLPKNGASGGIWIGVLGLGSGPGVWVFAPLIHRSTQSAWLIVRPGKWSMEVDVGAGDWRLEVEQGGQEPGKKGVAS